MKIKFNVCAEKHQFRANMAKKKKKKEKQCHKVLIGPTLMPDQICVKHLSCKEQSKQHKIVNATLICPRRRFNMIFFTHYNNDITYKIINS